jgi:hypothetical protein
MEKNKNYVGKIFYWFTMLLCLFRLAGSILLISYTFEKLDPKTDSNIIKILIIDIFYTP